MDEDTIATDNLIKTLDKVIQKYECDFELKMDKIDYQIYQSHIKEGLKQFDDCDYLKEIAGHYNFNKASKDDLMDIMNNTKCPFIKSIANKAYLWKD